MDPPDGEYTMERFPRILEHPAARRHVPTPATGPAHLVPVPQPPDAGSPGYLAAASTRELRILCDRTYRVLDSDFPSPESRERYDVLVEELERRELQAERRGSVNDTREKFRDNALLSRFELYRNGVLAAYLQYAMRGGDILLLHSVIVPRFGRLGLESVLMQAVLLNAHRRRLAIMPYCPEAQDFLNDHPQFLPLIPAKQRRRFTLLLASRAAAAGQQRR